MVGREVERAEERASASRASLADAQAALRHATEAVRAHTVLEMVGEVMFVLLQVEDWLMIC